MDPHEEEVMELPELNEERIKQNARDIKSNKLTIRVLATLIISLLLIIIYLLYKQHTLENCQSRLFTHITGQDAPAHKDLHAKPIQHLEKVEKPQVYRDLFEEDCKGL